MMRLPLLLAALLAAAPLAAQPGGAPSAAAPGDLIRLVVWRVPEFTGEFMIAPDGTILHPLLNEVRVSGVPEAEVRAQITRVLSRFETDPRFVFSLLHRVAVTGEVRTPGLYPVPTGSTIPEALAAAGGMTQFSREGRVRLHRGGETTVLDLRSPDVARMPIRPGDRLEVPRQTSLLRDVIAPLASVASAIGVAISLAR